MEMKTKILSEEEIDRIVVAQADDDAAWGKSMEVKRANSATTPRRKRRGVGALKKQRNGGRREKS
jgi:hypothetical protein